MARSKSKHKRKQMIMRQKRRAYLKRHKVVVKKSKTVR